MRRLALVPCLLLVAAKQTPPHPAPMTPAEADAHLAALPEETRAALVDAERYRRSRLDELRAEMDALREELSHYRPKPPPGARPRKDVERDLDDRRETYYALADGEDFVARDFVHPIQPGQVGRFTKTRVRRVLGPRAMLIASTDSRGYTDHVLLTGRPTAGTAADATIELPGVFRIAAAKTPKGETIPQAIPAPELGNAPPALLQAVTRLVDRTDAKKPSPPATKPRP